MADGEARNIGGDDNESKVCTKKCSLIAAAVIISIALLAGIIVAIVLMSPTGNSGNLMSSFTLNRRSLDRFRRNHKENKVCWDRHPDKDSFFSVIDTHNHFRPFGGPAVEFDTYLKWMQDAGIIFSTMFGIGQLIKKTNEEDPDCCYYLHCPTLQHKVVPDPFNDRKNAENYMKYLENEEQKSKVHLLLSATFPNLQRPENITRILGKLEGDFPQAFGWAGEINVIKHALVGNGFFDPITSPRITKKFLTDGHLDDFFKSMERKQWPVTIHCDCGCDNYNAIPKGALDDNPVKDCHVPEMERDQAQYQDNEFWRNLLGPFYPAFFYSETHQVKPSDRNYNKPNLNSFRKVQHLHLMDTILTRYPRMKVVWAHMCLNKELLSLHPRVHAYILEQFLTKFPYLYVDLSWDVLAKMLLLNYDESFMIHEYSEKHPDIHAELDIWNKTHSIKVEQIRATMHEKWEEIKDDVHATGSHKTLTGPTYAFVVYLNLIEKFPDRFVTGTDFVSSMGEPDLYPGLKKFKWPPGGCMKDEANHRRQVTDTSSVNIFFNDDVFRKVVLGENYFKLTGLAREYAAPEVCQPESVMKRSILEKSLEKFDWMTR